MGKWKNGDGVTVVGEREGGSVGDRGKGWLKEGNGERGECW